MSGIPVEPYTSGQKKKSPPSRNSIVYLVIVLLFEGLIFQIVQWIAPGQPVAEVIRILVSVFGSVALVLGGIFLIRSASAKQENPAVAIVGLVIASIGVISSLFTTLVTVLALIAISLQ